MENYKGYEIEIKQDEINESPRDWDNSGKMICFHNRYNLGDEHSYNTNDYGSWDEMKKAIIKEEAVAVILPLFLYDHSGITMNTTGFSCRWDSGQVGFIIADKDTIKENYGVKRISAKLKKRVEQSLLSEVKVYDQYLTGDVYGYIVSKDGEVVDSCWGFYGYDDCVQESKSIIDYYVKEKVA